MSTHVTNLKGKIKVATSHPTNPLAGDEYYNTTLNIWNRYGGSTWYGFGFTSSSTSTSTSTSSSTSTSTTSTSSSTSTTTSTSTSTTTTI